MKTVTVFVGSGLAALAAALPQPASTPAVPANPAPVDTIIVSLERSIGFGKEFIAVKRSTDDSLLHYACGNKLTFRGVDVEVTADDKTQGTIKVDGKEYDLGEDAELTGGAVCGGRWNALASAVDCEVPWPASLDDAVTIPEDGPYQCISDDIDATTRDSIFVNESSIVEDELIVEEGPIGSIVGESLIFNETELISDTTPAPGTGLEERQTPCTAWSQVEVPKNNNPRKWLRWEQVSGSHNCGKGGTCSGLYWKEYTVTHSADITLGFKDWVSGGFSVSKSVTTTDGLSCDGKAEQTVCVWSWRRSQAYDARRRTMRNMHCSNPVGAWSKWYRITSPLKGNHNTALTCYRGKDCWGHGKVDWANKGDGRW